MSMISVLLGTEHTQLEENIMKILLAIGWLLVLAFVYEADAGTIDARNGRNGKKNGEPWRCYQAHDILA